MRVELRNLSASDAFPRLDEAYTVLCTGLAMPTAGGGWSDWALVHYAIGSVDDGPLNRMLIGALACAVQPAMQRGFVGLLERESVRRYRTTVFQMAGRNAVLRMFVLEYLLEVEQRRTDDVMVFFGSLASQWEFDMVCVFLVNQNLTSNVLPPLIYSSSKSSPSTATMRNIIRPFGTASSPASSRQLPGSNAFTMNCNTSPSLRRLYI